MSVSWGKSLLAGMLAALGVLPPASSAAGDGSLRFEPASKWTIDYDDESCALRRRFTTNGIGADLEILQQAPGPYFRVTVTTDKLALSGSEAKVRFDPDDRRQVPEYLVSRQTSDRSSIAFTDSLRANVIGSSRTYVGWRVETRARREQEITSLSIDEGFDRNVTIATGEMHTPMEAMRACLNDLYASWGVDLDAHETLVDPLRPQNYAQVTRQVKHLVPSTYFHGDSDMPAVVRTIVGPNGRVVRCRVQFAEWPEQLSDEICELVTREARFLPARDRARRSIASFQAFLIEP